MTDADETKIQPETKNQSETKTPGEIKAECFPSGPGEVSALASANAPMIVFDNAPFLGVVGGVGQISLAAQRYIKPHGNTVISDCVLTAHLRAGLPALRALRFAVDETIKMLEEEQNRERAMAIFTSFREPELPN